MKRLICMVAIGLLATVGAALAQGPSHYSGGLGFHNSEAPIGVRWWLNGQKLALDAGVGFGSNDTGTQTLSHWALDLGVPIALKTWDRVHFMVRPGILYLSEDVPTSATTSETGTSLGILGELEAEFFVADNLSISASHGIEIVNNNPPGPGGSTTDWSTIGNNFTEVGFHVYLFGPGK